jgi:uncharacterized protein (DUF433 family)
MVTRTGSERQKMRRVPGIVFADGPAGRRARIDGTGVEVFEVIKAYHEFSDDRRALVDELDWLTPQQIAAALAYYGAYPDEIDAMLARQAALAPE